MEHATKGNRDEGGKTNAVVRWMKKKEDANENVSHLKRWMTPWTILLTPFVIPILFPVTRISFCPHSCSFCFAFIRSHHIWDIKFCSGTCRLLNGQQRRRPMVTSNLAIGEHLLAFMTRLDLDGFDYPLNRIWRLMTWGFWPTRTSLIISSLRLTSLIRILSSSLYSPNFNIIVPKITASQTSFVIY